MSLFSLNFKFGGLFLPSVNIRDFIIVVVFLVREVGRGEDAPHRVDQRHHEEQNKQKPENKVR
jgi:hypothetical protein